MGAGEERAGRVEGGDGGLGDLATVDVCGLLDVAVLPASVRHQSEMVVSFDHCVLFAEHEGREIQVHAELSGPGAPEARPDRVDWLPDPLRAHLNWQTDEGCNSTLVTKGAQAELTFSVRTETDPKRSALCDIATAMLKGAAAKMADGRVGHITDPPDSFRTVDPCGLLTSEQVDQAMPMTYDQAVESKATKHHCGWGKGDLALTTDITGWPLDPARYQPETIAGRDSFLSTVKSGELVECTIVTPHVDAAAGRRETARLTVRTPQSRPDPCVPARTLAAIAWAKLPTPS
ncbi:DUF3558 family protein [Actinokineospora sp. HUAS TT18]|uniref:DUF3558 family protein n=1 Tax=Actinokineospora sp. HUAS TT18 TaxID=3447451 RepID=UPI003F51F882